MISCNSRPTFKIAVQKVWTFSLTDEPDTAITITVNGVRVADISAKTCEYSNWGDYWTNTDYEAAEMTVISSSNDLLDGYKVVGKEGNYMIYFKLFAVVKLVYLM